MAVFTALSNGKTRSWSGSEERRLAGRSGGGGRRGRGLGLAGRVFFYDDLEVDLEQNVLNPMVSFVNRLRLSPNGDRTHPGWVAILVDPDLRGRQMLHFANRFASGTHKSSDMPLGKGQHQAPGICTLHLGILGHHRLNESAGLFGVGAGADDGSAVALRLRGLIDVDAGPALGLKVLQSVALLADQIADVLLIHPNSKLSIIGLKR
mmetsp:Transcript_32446/g.69503  ORF Transcript_32446/g.69503 Transcript_32446/m.69503 type:complete len:207 (-) Transcript_32446:1055-1675(-)